MWGAEPPHKTILPEVLRNWRLRNREGLDLDKIIKKFEGLATKWEFLNGRGWVVVVVYIYCGNHTFQLY